MESESKNREKEAQSGKKKEKWSLSYLLGGKVLIEDFVVKQSKLLFLIFCLILLFISNRYYCSKKVTEMDKLKRELVDLNSEQVFLISRLTKISGQSKVEDLLKEKGIELTKGSTTVYQIRK
jgi:hypothetical protein